MVEQVKDSTLESKENSAAGVIAAELNSEAKPRGKAAGLVSPVSEDQLLYLSPEEIIFPDDLDVRPWSRKLGLTDSEIEEIDKLAETISEEGQIDPVKVMRNDKGQYIGLTGGRRTAAIAQINAGKGKNERLLKVKAIFADKPIKQAHAFRQAAISNIQRKGLSPMDFAACIRTVRENVKGFATPAKLAEYFTVSSATISQHLKLLELSEDIQMKVHTGEISRDAAFALASVKPEKRAEVLAKASEIQQAEVETAKAIPTPEQTAVEPAVESEQAGGKTVKAKKTPRDTKTLKARNVKAAVRETEAASTKAQPRSKKELIEWFEANQGPVYGYPNGSIHKFLAAFIKFAAGELTERTLDKYFGEMVAKADRGKREPAKDEGKK